MTEDARLAHWLASQRAQVTRETPGDPHAHVDVDTLTRHACGQLSRAKAHAVTDHLLVCEDGRCVEFVRAQATDADAAADFLYPKAADADAMHAKTFTCRDLLWDTFTQVSNELEAPIDDLINLAMVEYARSRGYHEGPTERRQEKESPLEVTQDARSAPRLLSVASASRSAPTRPPADSEELSESEPSARGRGASLPPPTLRPGAVPSAFTPEAVPRAPQSARAFAAQPPVQQSVTLNAPRAVPPPPASRGRALPPPPARGGLGAPPSMRSAPGSPSSRRIPPPLPSTPSVPMPPPGMPAAARPAAGIGNLPLAKRLVLTFEDKSYDVDKDHFIIGRSKSGADLRIDDPNVSRQHAAIERMGSIYYLVDLGSTNGVYIGEDKVTRRAIVDGDVLAITQHRIKCALK